MTQIEVLAGGFTWPVPWLRAHRGATAAILGAVFAAAAGCSTFSGPRTVAPGCLQHGIAAELGSDDGEFMVAPTYLPRLGVSRRVDAALHLGSRWGADVKWNFLRDAVDLAVNPALDYLAIVPINLETNQPGWVAQAPLIVGVPVSDAAEPIAVGAAAVTGFDDESTQLALRAGLGVELRLGQAVMLQPELNFVWFGKDATERNISALLTAGLSVKLGGSEQSSE